jgi:hypothetical protein
MKAYVILVMMLAMTIFIIGDVHAVTDSKIPPKDQPNFHPKITKEKINEKNLEIVEFQCKLAK